MFNFDFIEDKELRAKAETDAKAQFEQIQISLNDTFQKKLDETVEGLKSKNDELLDEKKQLQEKFKNIEDPTEALEALNFFKENEDAQLIKEGKYDELIERKTTTMREEYDTTIKELTTKVEELTGTSTKYKNLFQSKTIDDAVTAAAREAGVVDAAIPDIVNRARTVFSLNADEKTVEARDDKGELVRTNDDKKDILTTKLWVDSLKNDSHHYWPPSETGRFNPDFKDLGDKDRNVVEAAKSGDADSYRASRRAAN